MFIVTFILNMKVIVSEMKHYQLKNGLIKLDYTWKKDIINDLKKIDTSKIELTLCLYAF